MLSGSLLQQEQHNEKKIRVLILTPEVLSIYTNNPSGNIGHERKTDKI